MSKRCLMKSSPSSGSLRKLLQSSSSANSKPSVSSILHDMETVFPDDAERLCDSCIELNRLAYKNSKIKDKILRNKGAQVLVKAMRTHLSDQSLQTTVCSVLHNLAILDAHRTEIMLAGGVEALLDAMRLHANDADVQLRACGTLINLSCGENAMIKRRITSSGGAQLVIANLLHPKNSPHRNNVQVQRIGVALLRELAYEQDNHETLVLQAGIVSAILTAMKRHRFDEGIQGDGCAALANLLAGATTSLVCDNNKSIAQQQDDEDDTCCSIHSTMAAADAGSTVHRSVQKDGLVLIVSAMKDYPDSLTVQTAACMALDNLAYSASRKRSARGAGGGDHLRKHGQARPVAKALLQALKAHKRDVTIQQGACSALHSLAYMTPKIRDYIVKKGGIPLLLAAIKASPKDEKVQRAAVGTLTNLAFQNVDHQVQIASHGGIEIMQKASKLYNIRTLMTTTMEDTTTTTVSSRSTVAAHSA